MIDKIQDISAHVLKVNETTDHEVMLTVTNRAVHLVIWKNGFSKIKNPVALNARLDDRFVGIGNDIPVDDIIAYLEDLEFENIQG